MAGRVLYGFAYDFHKSNFVIVVMWKAIAEDNFSFVSQFSTANYEWSSPVVCPCYISQIFYHSAIHINGKLYWTGVRPAEDVDIVHFIMCYNTGAKDIISCDIDLVDGGFPEYITVVGNKIGVIFRQIITNERVTMNLRVSDSDDLSALHLVHYIHVDRITQEYDVIGFEDNSLVLFNSCLRNRGIERDIVFCYHDRYFVRTLHGTLPSHYHVKQVKLFKFSDVVF